MRISACRSGRQWHQTQTSGQRLIIVPSASRTLAISPVCLSSFWQNGRAQKGNRSIWEPQATCTTASPSGLFPSNSMACRLHVSGRAAFDIFHIAYMSVNEARRSRVLGKISRRLRHPSHDKMLRVSRQNGRPSDVWVGATKARTQRGIFPCRIHAPPIRQGNSLEIRYPQYDHDHSTAQTPSNKPTNQRQARNESSSYLSVIFSPLAPPPLSDATHTNTAAAHLRSMPARQSRSSLPFGQLADIVQVHAAGEGRVSLGTQTPFCRPACFLPRCQRVGVEDRTKTPTRSLSGTIGSPRLSPAGSALLSALLASMR